MECEVGRATENALKAFSGCYRMIVQIVWTIIEVYFNMLYETKRLFPVASILLFHFHSGPKASFEKGDSCVNAQDELLLHEQMARPRQVDHYKPRKTK